MSEWMRRARLAMSTARHLRARQALSLARRRLTGPPRLRAPGPVSGWDPRVARALADLGPVDCPAAVTRRMAGLGAGRVEILGIGVEHDATWRYQAVSAPLWHYHLHYHDHLAEAAWSARGHPSSALSHAVVEGLTTWIGRNASGGGPAWDPYPVSVRLVNWLRIVGWSASALPPDLQRRMLELHAAHVDLVRRGLERHLEANHLLRNAWGLVLGAHAWNAPDAPGAAGARDLYFNELVSQTDTDGMHEERAPMYHVRAVRDALEVLAVLDRLGLASAPEARRRIAAMAGLVPWLRRMDGSLYPLNDAMPDHGVDLDRLLDLARSILGVERPHADGVRHLRGAGLVIAVDRRVGDRVAVDLGGPAPAHQPGHAHAGALGVEIDLGGRPVLVDPGCTGYDGDPFRPYFRGTRAHNTVMVGGMDQSEMWATFRVARRATVRVDGVDGGAADLLVTGSCRPYHDRSACHRRTIRRRGRTVDVEDTLSGGAGKLVELHWHLHPDWDAEAAGETLALRHGSGARAMLRIEGADATTLHRGERRPHLGWYAGGFARPVPTWTVRAAASAGEPRRLRTLLEPEP
jgi:uncharacterized heparinase superfamily protein